MNLDGLKDFITGIAIGAATLLNQNAAPLPSSPPTLPQESLERHKIFHYPEPEDLGEAVKPTPYLTLPFKKGQSYDVSQGWIYSQEELNIHHANPIHAAIDFHVPYGTQIFAPVAGYAIASYQTEWVREGGDYKEHEKPILNYQGKPIRLGLGYFIYLYVPEANRFLEFAHLSDIDPSIPFSPPKFNPKTEGWDAENIDIAILDMPGSPAVKYVSKGDPLGWVGYSGLTWGYDDYTEGSDRPVVIDPQKDKSWDIPHLHFEEFWINQQTRQKGWQRDPYAIYSTFEIYPTQQRKNILGKDPLWILDENNLPQFVKQ